MGSVDLILLEVCADVARGCSTDSLITVELDLSHDFRCVVGESSIQRLLWGGDTAMASPVYERLKALSRPEPREP